MPTTTTQALPRRLSDLLRAKALPHRYIASQLRRPRGLLGRWVMPRALDRGNAQLVRATLDALALREEDVFLDVGFGGGLALRLAAQRTRGALYGADFSPDVVLAGQRRLATLLRRGRLNLLISDIADLPLRDALFSALCTTNTIYFWPDPALAAASLRRVAAPAARLAIGYSGADKLGKFDDITRNGFRLYQPADVEALLRAAGFEHVRTQALQGPSGDGDFVTLAVAPSPAA